MLNKRLKQWGIIFSALFLTALIVIAGTPDLPVKATETPAYAIALTGTNLPNIPGEGFGAGSLTAKSVNFAYVNADDNVPSGQHVLLSYSGGAINNTNLITGLSRVTAIFSTGDLTLYYGNDLNPTANSAALPSGVAFSFSESIYFRIVASGTVDALIESIVIGYSCVQPGIQSGFTFTETGETYSLTGYVGTAAGVVIPSYYLGRLITDIGSYCFYGNTDIHTISIPDTVITISSFAFMNCAYLSNVFFGYDSHLEVIGNSAFQNCIRLPSFMVPNNTTYLGSSAFAGCRWLADFTLTDHVTYIGDSCFYSVDLLSSFTLPSGITEIRNNVFQLCEGLLSISIPSSVTLIGNGAFLQCTHLTTVTFEGESQLSSIGSYAFSLCPALANITLPGNLTTILDNAFAGDVAITALTIPSTVTQLDSFAFSGCDGLTTMTIPYGITTLSASIFSMCDHLVSVNLPSTITSIANGAFYFCTGLQSITIPSAVTTLGSSSFYGCYGLTSITFESGTLLTSIGTTAFGECGNLPAIIIPLGVTYVGYKAFDLCHALTIDCEASEMPIDWNPDWNFSNCPVTWGYVPE